MKLTNRQAIDLFNGFKRLDNDKLSLGPKVRWSMAKNMRLLRSALKDYDKALVGIQRGPDKDPETMATQIEALFEIEIDVDLMKFALSDLNLEENKIITPVTLEALFAVINE